MKIERIPVDAVVVGDRRPSNGATVAAIAASMRMIGQLQPITVYEANGEAHLVAGRHRLEAAEFLGWDHIEAVFVTGDEIDRRLREISENLHRAELTVQERADQVAEWSDLVSQKEVLRQVGAKGGRPEGGTRKAARDLNMTEQEVRRAKKIASITPEAKEAAHEAGIDDNQSKLLAVAKAAPEQQVAKVIQIAGRPLNHFETKEQWVAAGIRWWNKGGKEWREEFLSRVQPPIMDARHG